MPINARPHRYSWIWRRLFGCALSMCLFSCAFAEGVTVGPDGVKLRGFGDVDLEKTVEYWATNAEQKITGELNLRIEMLTDVCDLKEREVKKLRLAVIAVAKRRLSSGKDQLTQFIYESELVDPEENHEHVEFEDKLIPYRAKSLDDGIVRFATRFERPLDQQPLWKKVLKNSLSEKQWARYEEHRRSRNRSILNVAVSAEIADLDDNLFFTETSRSELTETVMKELSTQITLDRPSNTKQAKEIVGPFFANIENFQDHLQPSQFQQLKTINREDNGGGIGWSR